MFKRTPAQLALHAAGTDMVLRQWGEVGEIEQPVVGQFQLGAKLPLSALLAEVDIAQAFVADSPMRPMLTGIYLGVGPVADQLQIMAFDGAGALFSVSIDAKTTGSGYMIVPTADFILGARLVGDGDVIVANQNGKSVVIVGESSYFRSSLIAGLWPDTGRITSVTTRGAMAIRSSQIKNLVNSAKALGAGSDVTLGDRGGAMALSTESEGGEFATSLDTNVNPGQLVYHSGTLAKAARLGDKLTFSFPQGENEPTKVTANGRICWVVTRL